MFELSGSGVIFQPILFSIAAVGIFSSINFIFSVVSLFVGLALYIAGKNPVAVIFVISYNVTLLDQKNTPKVSSNTNITTDKKWWEFYGDKKKDFKKSIAKTIINDERFVGGNSSISVQSMTNTLTKNAKDSKD